jgi:hypothetical protein
MRRDQNATITPRSSPPAVDDDSDVPRFQKNEAQKTQVLQGIEPWSHGRLQNHVS